MKKLISLLLAVFLAFTLAACSEKKQNNEPVLPNTTEAPVPGKISPWPRTGYFTDTAKNMLSVTWLEEAEEPSWYVGCLLGEDQSEDVWSGVLSMAENSLQGTLPSFGEKDALTVTITEEGTDGLQLTVEGGETYHFIPYRMPEAAIVITFNVEGQGNINSAQGENAPALERDYAYQSAQINLSTPETYTCVAWPNAGDRFVKWMKDGADFSTEPQITVFLEENASFTAVFETDPDWRNPVLDCAGEYQSDRARAEVEADGADGAQIVIEWSDSAWGLACWNITGRIDPDTRTILYSGCSKSILIYNDKGEVQSAELEYENGTGSITFGSDGTFVWHEDQSESGTDLTFERVPTAG